MYNLLGGGLLAWVKFNGDSFAADYSPDLHFSSVCVNYTSSTKSGLRMYNVAFYIFPTVVEEFSSTSVHVEYSRLCTSLGS